MNKRYSVDIALPVYYGNVPELEQSVIMLVNYCEMHLKQYKWNIVIAINGKQPEKVIALAKKFEKKFKKRITHVYTASPGKGHGIIAAWSQRKTDIYAYMDIDLATDLSALVPLLKAIEEGNDIVGGSRYHPLSKIKRSLKRYIISRGYTLLFYRSMLVPSVRDPQCGFKAVTPRVVKEVLPLIKDKVWFWESEMIYLAYKMGMKIREIPVIWVEKKISGVNLVKIIPDFIKNVFRMRFTRIR
ncbi:MAG TPA: glycosyltransferase [Candidatus Nanoarchaeia archaeon]|nr:glycosyltransferase [Candidatus Nanoarchaeia archaeon]